MPPSKVGKNRVGRLYGLTALCPIAIGTVAGESRSYVSAVADQLASLPTNQHSPFAAFPNTYFARFYILRDVFYESRPARKENLKSQYLVFSTNFHGSPKTYLTDLWNAGEDLRAVWQHCVGFAEVKSARRFVGYIRKCQVDNALLFNGSTDQPLEEQLKGLYLKQRFGEFAATHQGLAAGELQAAFKEFVATTKPDVLSGPSWRAGAATLDTVEVS